MKAAHTILCVTQATYCIKSLSGHVYLHAFWESLRISLVRLKGIQTK